MPPATQPLLGSIDPKYLKGLDPVYVEYYNKYQLGRLPSYLVPMEEVKKNGEKYGISFGMTAGPFVEDVRDVQYPVDGGEVDIRIYSPPNKENKLLSAYINYHGGGWSFGDASSDSSYCRKVCTTLGCLVLNVNYRHAPEFRFPIPVEDGWTGFKWVRKFFWHPDIILNTNY